MTWNEGPVYLLATVHNAGKESASVMDARFKDIVKIELGQRKEVFISIR